MNKRQRKKQNKTQFKNRLRNIILRAKRFLNCLYIAPWFDTNTPPDDLMFIELGRCGSITITFNS